MLRRRCQGNLPARGGGVGVQTFEEPAGEIVEAGGSQQGRGRDRGTESVFELGAQLHRLERVEPQDDQRLPPIHRRGVEAGGPGGPVPQVPAQSVGTLRGRSREQPREIEGRFARPLRAVVLGCRRCAGAFNREGPREVGVAAGAAPDLAAAGAGQGPRTDTHDVVCLDLVLLGDGLAHGTDGGLDLGRVGSAAAQLVHQDQPLPFGALHREGGAASRLELGMALGGGELEILRIVVAAADDDQILEAAGDVEMPPVEETEITGAQERALARCVGEARGEGLLAGLVAPPVARGHARPGDPDLPDPSSLELPARLGVDDHQPLVAPGTATADEGSCRAFVTVFGSHGNGAPFFEGVRREGGAGGLGVEVAAGHEEGGLGQAVAGVEGPGLESAGCEAFGEPCQGCGPHRLGAAEGHLPARQVEPRELLGADLAATQLVGEVGTAAGGGAVARDGLEPAHRPPQEGHGCHEDRRGARVEGFEHIADQPHVVEQRQPADDDRALRHAEGPADHLQVVEQIAVRDHHPFGLGGGARGVLQVGESLRGELGRVPVVLRAVAAVDRAGEARGDLVAGDPLRPGELGGLGRPVALQDAGMGQHPFRPGVAGDRRGATILASAASGWVGGDGEETSVEATEKGGDELEVGREEQEHRVAREGPFPPQPGGDGPSSPIELAVGQALGVFLAVAEEGEGEAPGMLRRPPPEEKHEVLARWLENGLVSRKNQRVVATLPPRCRGRGWPGDTARGPRGGRSRSRRSREGRGAVSKRGIGSGSGRPPRPGRARSLSRSWA